MPETIVADTSCLIALTRIDQLHLLHKVYGKVIITPEIKKEFKYKLPDWFEVKKIANSNNLMIINALVDSGEGSAIQYCLERDHSLLIIDDNKGRKLAKRMNIKITGTLGVIAKAKQRGLINSVIPYLDALEKADFRFDQKLKALILKSAGEY